MLKILEDLILLARERKKNPIKDSYTNKLLEDKFLAKDKVLEEVRKRTRCRRSSSTAQQQHDAAAAAATAVRSCNCIYA